jgi:hypothetical protein
MNVKIRPNIAPPNHKVVQFPKTHACEELNLLKGTVSRDGGWGKALEW